MISIDLSDRDTYPIGIEPRNARVWTSARWEDGFTHRPDIVATQSTWAINGAVSTASLEYRFGRVKLPGSHEFATLAEITARGYFVLIEWPNDGSTGSLHWLGFAETPTTTNRHHGDAETPEGGSQAISCFGLERLLDLTRITSTVHRDRGDGDEIVRVPGGAVFNKRERVGNRYTFEDEDEKGPVFEIPSRVGDWWSSRDIVRHVLTHHLPTETGAVGSLPWSADESDMAAVPDWDQLGPIDTDNKSVGELLRELLKPSHLLGYRVEPVVTPGGTFTISPPTISEIRVVPFTITPTAVALGIGTVPATNDSIDLTSNGDPLTELKNKSLDSTDAVEQVVIRGPREIAVGSFILGDDLEKTWTTTEQNHYEDGARTEPGFADDKQTKQRETNERVRDEPEFGDVYRSFKIKKDWNGTLDGSPWFHDVFVPYLDAITVLDRLPFYTECDYTGAADQVDESEGKKRRLSGLLFEIPRAGGGLYRWTTDLNLKSGDFVGVAFAPFSVTVGADNEKEPGIRLAVSGAPSHAINPGFIGNPADTDQEVFGGWDWNGAIATVAIESHRRPQFAYPETISPVPDFVRRKTITIESPWLELVSVAAGTVVGLNPDGSTKTSDGGLLRDPFERLESIAKLVAERQLNPKHSISLETGRRLSNIKPGAVIQYFNGETVDAVVNEITITAESVENPSVGAFPAIKQVIKATTPAVDVLALIGAIQ